MIFELASTWKEGIVLILIGTVFMFVGGYLKYKRKEKVPEGFKIAYRKWKEDKK